MSKRVLVKAAPEELIEWKTLFNDLENWGIRKRLNDEKGVYRNKLNSILRGAKTEPEVLEAIRDFTKSINTPQK